jgi:hypothetical protein
MNTRAIAVNPTDTGVLGKCLFIILDPQCPRHSTYILPALFHFSCYGRCAAWLLQGKGQRARQAKKHPSAMIPSQSNLSCP